MKSLFLFLTIILFSACEQDYIKHIDRPLLVDSYAQRVKQQDFLDSLFQDVSYESQVAFARQLYGR